MIRSAPAPNGRAVRTDADERGAPPQGSGPKFGGTVAVSYTHLDVYKRQPLDGAEGGRKAEKPAPAARTEETPAEKIDFSKVKIEPLFEEMVDFDTFAKSDYRAVKIEACEAVPKSKKLLKFTLNDGTCLLYTSHRLCGFHRLLYGESSASGGAGELSAHRPGEVLPWTL